MLGNKENNTYLSQILDKQNEILIELKNTNNNIVKYFGEEYDLKEKELTQKIKNAHFTNSQFELLKEVIKHVREKHSKNNNHEHEWILCGLTTIRNPTVTKSSLSNGQYKFFECIKCGEHKFELVEGTCSHNWIPLGQNACGEHYACSKCKAYKVYPIKE